MKNITTGIDKLLQLVQDAKKISSEEAAKQLNLGKDVIEEWAELLEQEKIVKLTFKLSKMYIEARKLNEHVVLESAKKVRSERDAFNRKIEATIKSLDRDTAGFEEVKKEFEKVQLKIKDELETVRGEMKELEHYNSLKQNIDAEIEEQKKDYAAFTQTYDEQITQFDKDYEQLVAKLKREETNIKEFQDKIDGLRKDKESVEATINKSLEELKNVSSDLDGQIKQLKLTEQNVQDVRKKIDNLTMNIDQTKKKNIQRLAKIVGLKREKIEEQQDALLREAKERLNQIKDYADGGKKIYEDFSDLFKKKIETTDLIANIEKEKYQLRNELLDLQKKVNMFSLVSKSKTLKEQFGDIEKTIERYEERKHLLVEKIHDLLGFIKG